MTFSFFIKCNDCDEKYRIRYGLGNSYPQIASFECHKCSNLIETGYEAFNRKSILRGATIIDDDSLYDKDIRVQNLHPEIPTTKVDESNPFHFNTIDVFKHVLKDKETLEEFQEEQFNWTKFNDSWKEVEKPLRILSKKNKLKLKEICGLTHDEFTQQFNTWVSIFISGKQSLNFNKIKAEYNSVNSVEIKNYIQNENKLLKKIYELCKAYMTELPQFQSTILHQKMGWELTDEMFSNINWNAIEKIYGDLYETVGDFYVIPTMINNLKSGRQFDKFQTEGFTLSKYLKSDKAGRAKNFESNPNLSFLSEPYFSWLRNGTFHKNSFLNSETKQIELGTSKGGTEEKTIPIIEYIKNCNELFGIGIILSSLILEMKK